MQWKVGKTVFMLDFRRSYRASKSWTEKAFIFLDSLFVESQNSLFLQPAADKATEL
jgi:hypothetical protein